MSRRTVRIVLLTAIGVAILITAFATVQAASAGMGSARGRSQLTAGLLPDLSRSRDVASPLSSYVGDSYEGGHGGCEEKGVNPSDY